MLAEYTDPSERSESTGSKTRKSSIVGPFEITGRPEISSNILIYCLNVITSVHGFMERPNRAPKSVECLIKVEHMWRYLSIRQGY